MSCPDAHRPVLVRIPTSGRVTDARIDPDKTTIEFQFSGFVVEVRCSCGFTAPPGVDSDEAVAYHISLMHPVPT